MVAASTLFEEYEVEHSPITRYLQVDLVSLQAQFDFAKPSTAKLVF